MSPVPVLLLALLAGLSAAPGVAGPSGHGAARWGGGGHYWVGGTYRPIYRPVYAPVSGAWWYGYPGYGFGWGLGLGYGAGWAVSAGFPVYYRAWPGYAVDPFGYAAPRWAPLGLNEDLAFVQQPPAVSQEPARPSAGYWYYCADPAGYHPYVQRCSQPWIAVQPQPSPSRP